MPNDKAIQKLVQELQPMRSYVTEQEAASRIKEALIELGLATTPQANPPYTSDKKERRIRYMQSACSDPFVLGMIFGPYATPADSCTAHNRCRGEDGEIGEVYMFKFPNSHLAFKRWLETGLCINCQAT